MMTLYFEAYPPMELPTPHSVAVSDLISSDTSGLRVPLYIHAECPEQNFVYVSTYLPAIGPLYVIPVYSNPSFMMSPFARAVSAITANGS